jgi:hypothetical protein
VANVPTGGPALLVLGDGVAVLAQAAARMLSAAATKSLTNVFLHLGRKSDPAAAASR